MMMMTPTEQIAYWDEWFSSHNWPHDRHETDTRVVFTFEEDDGPRPRCISIPKVDGPTLTREELHALLLKATERALGVAL